MRSHGAVGVFSAAVVLTTYVFGSSPVLTMPAFAEAVSESRVPLDGSFVGPARTLMERALAGARRRIATDACQRVFSDFADRRGRPLDVVLTELGRTPRQHFDALYFVEANVSRQCLGDRRLAFTAPGSRVVFICGQRFEPYLTQSVSGSEILLIHESLHALGLGENPPASQDISRRVGARCPEVPELRG
jgi:hypothetical protein